MTRLSPPPGGEGRSGRDDTVHSSPRHSHPGQLHQYPNEPQDEKVEEQGSGPLAVWAHKTTARQML